MLPESELSGFVSSENFSDEIQDSYGEIANIAAGAYSKSFEDLYPKACRLIRKEQEVIAPAKVDIESDSPVKNQNYFLSRQVITINGTEGGEMILMLPAATFGLGDVQADTVQPKAEEAAEAAEEQVQAPPAEPSVAEDSSEDAAEQEPVVAEQDIV